jgi:hypothetical protein
VDDDVPKCARSADDEPAAVTHEVWPRLELRPVPELAEGASREEIFASLRGLNVRYDDPFEPVGLEDWEALK